MRLGGEVIRYHIFEHAAIEGASLRIRGRTLEIGHTYQQFPIANGKLKDETKLMVTLNIVNHLNDGAIILASIVEHERMAGLDDGEPLPVGMHLRGEALEDGVLRICQNT